jgi:hypothetical protein
VISSFIFFSLATNSGEVLASFNQVSIPQLIFWIPLFFTSESKCCGEFTCCASDLPTKISRNTNTLDIVCKDWQLVVKKEKNIDGKISSVPRFGGNLFLVILRFSEGRGGNQLSNN